MTTYKIFISKGDYSNYYYVNTDNLIKKELPINPIKEKLLNQDIFTYQDGEITVVHSTVKKSANIPGVLVLSNGKTYGKHKKKFIYKCIPDDIRLPFFLIPYAVNYGFKKVVDNKYITFTYDNWDDKFPAGKIAQVMGDVSELVNFYEYNLYCKSLYASITYFKKAAMKKLRERSSDYFIDAIQKKYNPEIRHDKRIFAIDPLNSKDFDDAFGIEVNEKTTTISIYIANVSYWLDVMDLWGSFSQRISTIYLPDRKRPMLPTMLSDALCSLIENQIRYAFTLDMVFDNETDEFLEHKFTNSSIKIDKNFVYDTKEQENYEDYKILFEKVRKINRKYKYIDKVNDSHDVVAYLMIYMNYMCAKELKKYRRGIFRSAKLNNKFVPPENIPKNIQKFLKMWNSYGGKYCKFENIESHDMLELDAYVHITSPIRRLADLLNILELQDCLNIFNYNESSLRFYEKWTNDEAMEYINTTMKSIRKVQNDCSLLNICVNNQEILSKNYNGYIFDRIKRNDYIYQYIVYLPELKMVNRLTSRKCYENLSNHVFKIYVFMDEIRLKQKIRIEIVNNV